MARFIPSMLSNLHRLSWKEGLNVEDYQRLRIRLMLLPLCVAGISSLLLMLYWLVTMNLAPEAFSVAAVVGLAVGGVVLMAVTIWLIVMSLKVEFMRWRGLGLKVCAAVGMLVLAAVFHGLVSLADEIGSSPDLLLKGIVSAEVYTWLVYAVVLQVGLAVLSYWTYLEETPLRPVTVPQAQAFATAPGRLEKVLLLILQVWVWFGILSIPMYFIISRML